MHKRKILDIHNSILLPIFIITNATIANSETFSSPKNLVNLYTSSHYDNSTNFGLYQSQNEYQNRPIAAKSTSPDRYKSSSSPSLQTVPESNYDSTLSESSHTDTYDYSYQDNRGTTNVPECEGRLKLNGTRGFITDGPGFYQTNLQCIWIIDSGRENSTIRIQFHQFNTECNYDYLYIFDGDSIYSPLIASLSGDMKDFSTTFIESNHANRISFDERQRNLNGSSYSLHTHGTAIIPLTSSDSRTFELKASSGKAFVYFHSDTAQSMPGFYMTYSVDSCSLDCSNRGECNFTSLTCKCNPGYFGNGCQFVLCPNNCTSPAHGDCDKDLSCVCKEGFQGEDCSHEVDQQVWTSSSHSHDSIPRKAFHQAIIVNGIMWIIGGKTQPLSNTNLGIFQRKKTPTVFNFNPETKQWSDIILFGETGIDHLAELSGHSVAAKGNKIFIYGGMAMNNTVLDTLSVLDTKTNDITSLSNGKKIKPLDEGFVAPVAVVGHTANIVDGHMYIFLGYNPLFGYLNLVQKFNLANNEWSILENKGSSIIGYIGHTSSYDPISRLIFLYGGHHAHQVSHLYSFDPYLETWTYLQAGPAPRYYHSSVILNSQLVILGGNSYNTSHKSDQCFQHAYLTYDITCSKPSQELVKLFNSTIPTCVRKCWQTIPDTDSNVLQRQGHSIVIDDKRNLILFGGFNGMVLDDIRFMDTKSCNAFSSTHCEKPKLGLKCFWNTNESKCEDHSFENLSTTSFNESSSNNHECSKSEIRSLQHLCESRETCTDCLHTNSGCVWCSLTAQCQFNKCKSSNSKVILEADICYKDEVNKNSAIKLHLSNTVKDVQESPDIDRELDCKRVDNCYLCHSKTHCNWLVDQCVYNMPSVITSQASSTSPGLQDDFQDVYGNTAVSARTPSPGNSSRFMSRFDPFNRSFLAAFTNRLLSTLPYHSCDTPCFMRRSCNECTTAKCIWCSTTEQCVDSTAYFAYHSMGQCMHYVAHMAKCSVSSCADIETCDKCLTNPKCGWLNDISNTGKGKCIEGTSIGPAFGSDKNISYIGGNNSQVLPSLLSSWFYTSCPSCQCNGHSYCKVNSGLCLQPCQDNTEGLHCERCTPGYFGDPINGGSCRPCRCNGHAQSCNRETGKCYCSTKGIIGHTCNRCDDQNHYLGDPASSNGTCYYNLTTDYQYTFNMSKSEDHFYSDINLINVPLRKDSDVDFTIACSRLALVNITSGTSYKNRKLIHTGLECGSFRLRFPHERHILSDANYSFFVHVYKFQTPFILQIAFSQHRTLYLPQFFFTFSSCFLFFFALSGLVWKLKHEYDLYIRRQRQFIEMEQMASRPFSTILLEIFKPSQDKAEAEKQAKPPVEPTPISFEPCFGSNIGVLSFFVQLPGRPNLAIGSALVTLNDDAPNVCDDNSSSKQLEKDMSNSAQNS